MKKIIVVNGRPRAGKDTAVGYMTERLLESHVSVFAMSSIDAVRNMLRGAGIPIDLKTAKERDLLSEVAAALDKYNDFRVSEALNMAVSNAILVNPYVSIVQFVHMREPEMVNRLELAARNEGWDFERIMITGSREVLVESNASDRQAASMAYDRLITNDGTLEELRKACWSAVDAMLAPEKKPDSALVRKLRKFLKGGADV